MPDTKVSALAEMSVPDFSDDIYIVDNTGPTSNKIGSDRLFGTLLPHICQGRLTLTSGTAVTTTNVTSTSVYFTPYKGDKISIYDGTRWLMYTFTELTLALGTLTSGLPYDVFIYDNAGTLTLELLAWTNGTTRATALVLQNGIYCKTGALTRRYLGTFYTISTTETEDSEGGTTTQVGGKRFLWNYYNRVLRQNKVIDTADTWTYNSATLRIANAATAPANCLEFIVGVNEDPVRGHAILTGNAKSSEAPLLAIGLDNTTAAGLSVTNQNVAVTGLDFTMSALYLDHIGIGYHTLRWLEASRAGTSTFTGDAGEPAGAGRQSGLFGEIWG